MLVLLELDTVTGRSTVAADIIVCVLAVFVDACKVLGRAALKSPVVKISGFELVIVCSPISAGVVLKTAAGSTVLGASGEVGRKPVGVEVLVLVCAAGVVNCVVVEVIINKCVSIAGVVSLVVCGNGVASRVFGSTVVVRSKYCSLSCRREGVCWCRRWCTFSNC